MVVGCTIPLVAATNYSPPRGSQVLYFIWQIITEFVRSRILDIDDVSETRRKNARNHLPKRCKELVARSCLSRLPTLSRPHAYACHRWRLVRSSAYLSAINGHASRMVEVRACRCDWPQDFGGVLVQHKRSLFSAAKKCAHGSDKCMKEGGGS